MALNPMPTLGAFSTTDGSILKAYTHSLPSVKAALHDSHETSAGNFQLFGKLRSISDKSIHFIGSETSKRPLNCSTVDIDGRASLLMHDNRPQMGLDRQRGESGQDSQRAVVHVDRRRICSNSETNLGMYAIDATTRHRNFHLLSLFASTTVMYF